jgi:hypothetical protein
MMRTIALILILGALALAAPDARSQMTMMGIGSGSFGAGVPVTPCVQDGLDFTKSCNAVLYVVIFH